ncbi:MAG: hypothetical protein JSU64_05645 [candidate division WOR-3 bacterium]|nr:MAG: hypothetical protein JSU64_05645 [candidate division WOR-3 bacterium]
MGHFDVGHPCVVLGMYETGLAVGRSLGRKGIEVIGVDWKRDIGFRSRYVKPFLCPHPLKDPNAFLAFMMELCRSSSDKAVLFLTADEFVIAVSRMREQLAGRYLFNIPSEELLECIMNKDCLYLKAQAAGIPVPKTVKLDALGDLEKARDGMRYPVFVKGCLSYIWRERFGGVKGFLARDVDELRDRARLLLTRNIPAIVQEVIPGPDTNHFKSCCYVSARGKLLLDFTLQKMRQQPVRFGIGASVRSVDYPELSTIGRELFFALEFRGVGSAEFKLDENDHTLKLIELNPRYWQQNILADRCGMNFPVVDYLETTGQEPAATFDFLHDVKWINMLMDLNSFLTYRKERTLGAGKWLASLKGAKVFSDFALDDMVPALMEKKYWRLVARVWNWFSRMLFRMRRLHE